MPKVIKYGCEWNTGDPVAIELACIKNGGSWVLPKSGAKVGMGLVYHVKRFQSLVWPGKQWHRWNEGLILPELCNGGTVAIYGAASSGKTHEAGDFMLTMYWAFPQSFTGLVSSTTVKLLDLRIWGQIKKRFRQARERCPWLPGNLIESKQMLTSDSKDVEGREFRNGIIGIACKKGNDFQGLADYAGLKNDFVMLCADECFPAGTLVDTPTGKRKIETINAGDEIISAAGPRKVRARSVRRSLQLVRIKLSTGETIDCTPDHPVLTNMGWVNSIDLTPNHRLISSDEAMFALFSGISTKSRTAKVLQPEMQMQESMDSSSLRSLRNGSRKSSSKFPFLSSMLKQAKRKSLRLVQESICSKRQQEHFLREILLHEMEDVSAGYSSEDARQSRSNGDRKKSSRMVFQKSRSSIEKGTASKIQSGTSSICCCNEELDKETSTWSNGVRESRRKWATSHGIRVCAAPGISRSTLQLHNTLESKSQRRVPALLQARLILAGNKTGGRNRRRLSSEKGSDRSRQEEGRDFKKSWVDSVTLLNSASDVRFEKDKGGYKVYNFEIEGHPSYSVEGFIVHNCHMMEYGFLQGAANLKSNPRFIGVYLGNLSDLNTPLGEAAEPKNGWDSISDPEKSRVYPTRYLNGRAIQLIGMDSPNLDYPAGAEPFPKLIGRKYLAEMAADYGEGSPMFNIMAAGKIPRGSLEQRVITEQLCLQFNAYESVIWGPREIKKLYAADVNYTFDHGDRSPGMLVGFGQDVEGEWRLAPLDRPKIFAPTDKEAGSYEEQLAVMYMEECKRLGIPPECFFFDGTGRSSFTSAIMRIWSTAVNAIEFGGKASTRPNFLGRKYKEGPYAGEVMPCCEVFGKFVSELWFATRYLVEFNQCRGMHKEIIKEGSMRIWSIIAGNKMDVEPKKDMKLRLGRSPDLYDMWAVACEGARRMGFPLGTIAQVAKPRSSRWLSDLTKQFNDSMRKQELTYS